jgi:hypothetical protein
MEMNSEHQVLNLSESMSFTEFEEIFGVGGRVRQFLKLGPWDFRPRIPYVCGETLEHALRRFRDAKDNLKPE